MTASTLFANILLSVTSLVYVLLVANIYRRPMPGGDYGVGYAWVALILNGAFLVLLALAAWAIVARGGFQWVKDGGHSLTWVTLGVLSIAFVVGVSGMGVHEAPPSLRLLMTLLAYGLPLLTLAAGFGLANDPLTQGLPAEWIRKITLGVFYTGVGAGALFVLVHLGMRNGVAFSQRRNTQPSFDDQQLAYIDTCDIQKDFIFLFVHTHRNQPSPLRQRALARIQSHPDWQQEMVRRLDSGWAEQIFIYLADNEVEDKSLFPEAVRLGVLQEAKRFKEARFGPSSYPEQYGYEVDRILRTVEKFEGMGVDFMPAIRELRAAFEVPADLDKPPFKNAAVLDKWMKKHQ